MTEIEEHWVVGLTDYWQLTDYWHVSQNRTRKLPINLCISKYKVKKNIRTKEMKLDLEFQNTNLCNLELKK